uniref:Secreted protein n=1 Tax=Heterorhabditis bacteriophora TaxID=37862 RepID=A0A1I7W7N5_HETBA
MICKVIVLAAHILNAAFIDESENPRRIHYCQRKSVARALIRMEVIIEGNSLRRKTCYERMFAGNVWEIYLYCCPGWDKWLIRWCVLPLPFGI